MCLKTSYVLWLYLFARGHNTLDNYIAKGIHKSLSPTLFFFLEYLFYNSSTVVWTELRFPIHRRRTKISFTQGFRAIILLGHVEMGVGCNSVLWDTVHLSNDLRYLVIWCLIKFNDFSTVVDLSSNAMDAIAKREISIFLSAMGLSRHCHLI